MQDPAIKERDFRDFCKKRLGILLQKRNSHVILKKMKRLTMSDDKEEYRDSQFCIHYIDYICSCSEF